MLFYLVYYALLLVVAVHGLLPTRCVRFVIVAHYIAYNTVAPHCHLSRLFVAMLCNSMPQLIGDYSSLSFNALSTSEGISRRR